ncbi:hypothetical protein BFJ72_g15364, partial [Fusarium proliferatum]
MTRPATVAGVPQLVFGVLLIVAILAIILPVLFRLSFIWSIGGAVFGVLGFMSARIVCAEDPNAFEYLKVAFNFWRKAQGRTVARGIETEPSLALAIPYESHIERDIVSLDNGSLLAVLKFEGVFAETASDEELLRWHDSLCSMLMAIASPDLALWRTTHHYALKDFAPGVFDPGTFAHQFNEAYKARCLKEPLFANDLYLAVLIQGAGSLSRMGKGKGGFRQARDEQAAKLDGVCVRIEESLSSYKPRRLGMYRERNIEFSEIYEYLTLLLNGRKFKTPVTPHRAGDILNRSRYYFAKGADTFVRQCSGEREYG